MALNFAEQATKKIADIERPPLPPVGTYRWSITKLPTQATSNDEKWDFLTFQCRALEAMEDVDMDGYTGDVKNIILPLKFMFNKEDEAEFEKSLYRVRTFLEKHVKCAQEGDSIAQALNSSVNQQFLGSVVWNPGKNDPEDLFANLVRTAPID